MARFNNEKNVSKTEIMSEVRSYLGEVGLKITDTDEARPWGGFFVIDESQTPEFIDRYFPEVSKEDVEHGFKLSPKILVVEPGKRLSWQYHDRREELWRVISGPVGVYESTTNEPGELRTLGPGDTIQHGVQVRHRLVGLDKWGVVAEIWQHTDPENPSNEDDIERVQDDFGR